MLRITRWSPDTCGCVLEYQWDDALDETTRTHSFNRAVQLCEHHRALAATKAYDAVQSENTRKNGAFAEAQKIRPGLTADDFTWSFGTDRSLKVGFLGKLIPAEKADLRSRLDGRFGTGKVEVI